MEQSKRRIKYVYGSTLPREWEEEKKVPKRKHKVRRRVRRKVLPKGSVEITPVSHVVILAIACICVLLVSVNYLKVRADIKTLTMQISNTQSDITDLSQKNLDTKRDIEGYVDLDYIYKVATKELGMVPADKNQVIYYNKTESEYVRQNEDIPND